MAILPRWQLRFTRTHRDGALETLEFRCDELDVGRTGCDVTLPGPTVSRRHCALRVSDEGQLLVVDQSSNGTFLNGRRVRPAAPTRVRVGDCLTIGDWELSLETAPELVVSVMARSARLEALRDRQLRAWPPN